MYLLDTNIVSEMRKLRTRSANAELQSWAGEFWFADAFISVITILEIQIGMLRMARKDIAQAEIFRHWLHDQVVPTFAGRILVVDNDVALRCASLHVPVSVAYHDALIAATALVHGMTVVTRNVKHFEPMGVEVLNPWR